MHLIANQPATRLHSQLDFGGHSDQVFSVDAALSRARTALQAPPRGYEVRTIGE